MKRIEQTVEGLTLSDDRALIILAGDFNQLDVDRVAECTGLVPMVKVPTREHNILDTLLISELSKHQNYYRYISDKERPQGYNRYR